MHITTLLVHVHLEHIYALNMIFPEYNMKVFYTVLIAAYI